MAGSFGITYRGELIGMFSDRAEDDPSVEVGLWEPPEDGPAELDGWLKRVEDLALGEGRHVRTNGLENLDLLHLRALRLRATVDGIDTVLDDAPEETPEDRARTGIN